uniref:Uncharacterized protein n=1 Tax=Syphacia muris TaxID=451379 RepID=A0A0N5AAV9_9BILA
MTMYGTGCRLPLWQFLLIVIALFQVPMAKSYVVELPVGGIDNSVWNPYLQMGNGLRRMYLQRREIVSQRDLLGHYPNVQYFIDGPERVFYRRILTPIYATPSTYA